MYQFRLGEKKEIGVEIFARDNSSFTLTAQYNFESESGVANLDGTKVFTTIEPKAIGNQKCTFTITVTPSSGKAQQILKCPVLINTIA